MMKKEKGEEKEVHGISARNEELTRRKEKTPGRELVKVDKEWNTAHGGKRNES